MIVLCVSFVLLLSSQISLVTAACEKIQQGGCSTITGGYKSLPWCGQASVTSSNETVRLGDYKVFWKGPGFHRGYADNDAAVEWQHQDNDPSRPKIDWSKESQECKAAFLALTCASHFEWCKNDACKPGKCCQTEWGSNQNTNMRIRLFEDGVCSDPSKLWTRKWPDYPGNDGYDVVMPVGACMPDGTGGTGEHICRAAVDEPCTTDDGCWSETCRDGKCIGLEEGQPCWHESACETGDCLRSEPDAETEHRGFCEGLWESAYCQRDRQCKSKKCVNNECARVENGAVTMTLQLLAILFAIVVIV